jgi:tetratricopeptide (TPR) repeat protein
MNATSLSPRLNHVFLGIVICCSLVSSVSADEVQWRKDYNAARKEAAEKSRPIFLDIESDDCYHCRRLDAITFRDPAIVALLNERFIPLKIDGPREQALVQALRVNAYPTMVIAASDGKILGIIEGFLEANRLQDQLQRGLAASTPDWMARDFQEATKAIASGEYGQAVGLLKRVLEDGKDRPVQSKARQVLLELEQQATGRLTKARQMEDRGQTLEAVDLLTELLSKYSGTQAAHDGARLLTKLADQSEVQAVQRNRRATELLALARDDFRMQRYLSCLDSCDILVSTYKDLPQGQEGERLADQIRTNPERMTKVADDINERAANVYITLAESWMKKGDVDKASVYFDKVVKLYPESTVAEKAQVRLTSITNKSSSQPVQFKKP